jgi:hypothetical protein
LGSATSGGWSGRPWRAATAASSVRVSRASVSGEARLDRAVPRPQGVGDASAPDVQRAGQAADRVERVTRRDVGRRGGAGTSDDVPTRSAPRAIATRQPAVAPAVDEPQSSRRSLRSRLLYPADASVRRPRDLALGVRPRRASDRSVRRRSLTCTKGGARRGCGRSPPALPMHGMQHCRLAPTSAAAARRKPAPMRGDAPEAARGRLLCRWVDLHKRRARRSGFGPRLAGLRDLHPSRPQTEIRP